MQAADGKEAERTQEKLKALEQRYDEIEARMMDPAVYSDVAQLRQLSREQKELEPLISALRALRARQADLEAAQELACEAAFQQSAQEEIRQAQEEIARLQEQIKFLLLPKDPNDGKNVVMELRAGAGGEEAALFAHSLMRMYTMYAESKGWRVEVVNCNETELGGVKEAQFLVEGEGAWSRLKFESGVHRVQRVPETETQGRIQTSTATVAVLPEAEAVDVQLDQRDLQIDTFRSSGAGGQHVNKTESAIRITHRPTGLVVECQDERSQYKNKDRAMKILASRLLDLERRKQRSAIDAERRSQIGSADRSERIRTYNFPQGRVSDHRIGLTLYKIDAIMDGALDELIDALATADRAERLKSGADQADNDRRDISGAGKE